VTPEDFFAVIAAFPRLPGAACKGRAPMFDDGDGEEAAAVALCASCSALQPCRAWFYSLPRIVALKALWAAWSTGGTLAAITVESSRAPNTDSPLGAGPAACRRCRHLERPSIEARTRRGAHRRQQAPGRRPIDKPTSPRPSGCPVRRHVRGRPRRATCATIPGVQHDNRRRSDRARLEPAARPAARTRPRPQDRPALAAQQGTGRKISGGSTR
jgi:hypothetical protein